MNFLVYMLTNRLNGKRYIGVTTHTLKKRLWEHYREADKGNKFPLYRAMRKYGTDNFDITLLYEAVDHREMMAVERGLIAAYGTYRFGGYNATLGGQGSRGLKFSPEVLRLISEKSRGRKFSDKARKNMSDAQKRARAERPEEYFSKDSAKMKGKTRSEEDKEKKAEAARRYAQSPEGKADYAKRTEKLNAWRAANPERVTQAQMAATKAAAIATMGKTPSPEIQAKRTAGIRAAMVKRRTNEVLQ